ncbi:Clp protease ClpP [Paenalkalicoccus suaedae]|uniref:ATP-dependent Clp protease proteolytic subunit n=1 Tax=Paenalkalicoccus suaedae TaxID=2592382 RepID=A0A859FB54_9BACI|nr:head maturation protease, ClpP-related [Paenalkalicoccus suaedae]QKS70247.1 Clp protease ClpP [Paenalkalicoccus suaedae]
MKRINIKGVIVDSDDQWLYDYLDMEATSPKKFADKLAEADEDEEIIVEINSGGGYVWAASEIYTKLRQHKGDVKIEIVGIAASAASFIACAGKVFISPTAQMMIHNAWTMASGDKNQMQGVSEMLKTTDEAITLAYADKTNLSQEELLDLMEKETWMSATKAKELGFADEIMFEKTSNQAVASANNTGLIPEAVLNKLKNELIDQRIVASAPKKEEETLKSVEELKNQYPDLHKQVTDEAFNAGIKAENNRLKEIEELSIGGAEDLVNKAKEDPSMTAEKLAMQIVKAQKDTGANYLNQVQEDAQELNELEGSDTSAKNSDAERSQNAKSLAEAMNKKRGGK